MAAPRRHHLLPQFYLRSFTDAEGKVRVIDRASGREFTTGTTNVFVERDYYTVSSVDAEDDHALNEGLYAKVEGVAAPVFEKLRAAAFPLDGPARSEFASFMALQLSRGRMFRRLMEQLTDQLGRSMLRAAADAPPSYWEAKRAEWQANPEGPEPPPPLGEKDRQMLRQGTSFVIEPRREHVVDMSFAHLEKLTFVLMAMTWRLIVFDEPCLFSSEHPLSYWRESSPTDGGDGIGLVTADEVRLPIGPWSALVLTPPEFGREPFDRSRSERTYRGDITTAQRLNWGTLSFPPSERLLLAPNLKTHPLPVTVAQMHRGLVRP
jgi:hypothetical protein